MPPVRPAWQRWARHNLFRSWTDTLVTVISALVVGYLIFRLAQFVFVTGRWDIVRVNLTLFMVGRYPRDELWRVVWPSWPSPPTAARSPATFTDAR